MAGSKAISVQKHISIVADGQLGTGLTNCGAGGHPL